MQKVLATETDVIVAVFGTAHDGPLAVGRIVHPGRDDPGLRRNDQALTALRFGPWLKGLAPLLPEPLAFGEHRGRTYAVERAVVGTPARGAHPRHQALHRFLDGSATAISELHHATGTRALIDEQRVERWVGGPLGGAVRGALERR